MADMDDFIEGLPKAELHLHLEGSLEPPQMFRFAKRNKIDIPFKSVEEIQAAYQFSELQDFLDIYYQGANVLITEEDFYDMTIAYLTRVAREGVRHVEVFFDPQTHTDRGIAFATVIAGISRALKAGKEELNISSGLIMCFLRHLPEDAAFETLAHAEPHLDQLIGVGLDSSELGHPPSKFEKVFEAARERGLKLVAHAGEEGPPAYIKEALDILKVDRLDHGNRALEDDKLIARLVKEQMALTVCPLSNQKLCVVDSLSDHPLKRMLDLGLRATINSDDPAYFGGYLADNYKAVTGALGFQKADLIALAKNSFTGSFLNDTAKQEYISEIDAYSRRQ